MNIADIVIIILVAIAAGFAIRAIVKGKAHGSCCGSCGSCNGCSKGKGSCGEKDCHCNR